MRTAGLLITGGIAAVLIGGALFNAANYVFQFSPDKLSAEFGTTMLFVGIGLALGGVSAFCWVQIWKSA